MTVYIKREDAIDTVLDVYYNTPDIDLSGERLEAAILSIPAADVVPVIHCKDCVYAHPLKDSKYDYLCRYWNGHSCNQNQFCSQGKRKEKTK